MTFATKVLLPTQQIGAENVNDFEDQWWSRLYNSAASSVKVITSEVCG